MRVILDTNAFRDWGALRPPSIERILRASEEGDLDVLVPEVVIVECARRFAREHARPAAKKMRQAIHAAKQAGTLPPVLRGYRPDAAADRDTYEQNLRDELDAHGVMIIDLPRVDHDTVLDRIKHARKPSKDDDDQYRDILIWESIVEYLSALAMRRNGGNIGQTILLTSNHKDFGVAAGDPKVHPDLAHDLEQAGLARDAVALVAHPQELIGEHLAAKNEVTKGITAMLADEGGRRDLLADLRGLLEGRQVTGDMDWPYTGLTVHELGGTEITGALQPQIATAAVHPIRPAKAA